MSRLFIRKSIQDCENDILERGGLRRSLNKWHLTALGVGATIGAGIFATTGTAIVGDPLRPGAGPAIVLSFLLTALTCGFAALCYAEFAAMVPISGSAYTYAYASLGELVAWIIGWDLIIEYAVGNIGVAIGWAGYFRELMSHFGISQRRRWPRVPPTPPRPTWLLRWAPRRISLAFPSSAICRRFLSWRSSR
jgi:APA family basic amino acid/polyamine antiporter